MSTRSVIAVPHGKGFRGRYVHSDGYPSAKLPELIALLRREGPVAVTKMLLHEYYGWSYLRPTQPDVTGVTPPSEYPSGPGAWAAPDSVAYMLSPKGGYGDGRFQNVPGWGIAYTTKDGQSDPAVWIEAPGDNWGTEWAYVLGEGVIQVYESVSAKWSDPAVWAKAVLRHDNEGWLLKASLPFDADATEVAAVVAGLES